MAIIFGDEEGIGLLTRVCKKLGIKIDAVVPSLKLWCSLDKISIKSQLDLGPSVQLIEPSNREILNFIHYKKINFGVINSFDLILDRTIVENSQISILNLHGGKLPEYRGANVLNWALINGEKEIGITLHVVDEGIDTGPILHQLFLKIYENDTAVSLKKRMNREAEVQLLRVLPLYFENRIKPISQSSINVRHYRKRKPEDGFFTWDWNDAEIYNLIRALVSPWPGARYLNKNGEVIIIDKYMTIDEIKKLRAMECY